jgi:TetR/AcrR family transcriptional regulator, regulator of autoinduction and epiphytic fitness
VSTEPVVEPKVDGRRLRAERTRVAIVDGLLELIEAGNLRPTAPQIAEQAKVSLRTVFQHFAEVEALFAAVSERQIASVVDAIAPVDTALPLPERLDAFLRQRCDILERVTPIARAAQLQEPTSELVRTEADRLRRLGHLEVTEAFAPELGALDGDARDLLCAALAAIATWRTWETLRTEQGLDVERAQQVMRYTADAVLAAAGFSSAG